MDYACNLSLSFHVTERDHPQLGFVPPPPPQEEIDAVARELQEQWRHEQLLKEFDKLAGKLKTLKSPLHCILNRELKK